MDEKFNNLVEKFSNQKGENLPNLENKMFNASKQKANVNLDIGRMGEIISGIEDKDGEILYSDSNTYTHTYKRSG